MSIYNWVLLISLSVLWGGSFFFTEIALVEVSPLVIVAARVGGAAVILILLMKAKGMSLPQDMRLWAAFGLMGILNNIIPYSLIVWGQQDITGALASIFNATTPLFTIVLAHFLTRDEKITAFKFIGLGLGFIGVVVMVGTDALQGLGASVWAQIVILFAAISYGCAAIWGRRFKGLNPLTSAMGQTTCSALIMVPLATLFGFEQGYFLPSWDVIGALAGMAILCTVVAYILYFKILETAGATNLMLVTFLIPFSALFLGFVFLNETLSATQFIGMGLILIGLLVIDGRIVHHFVSKDR